MLFNRRTLFLASPALAAGCSDAQRERLSELGGEPFSECRIGGPDHPSAEEIAQQSAPSIFSRNAFQIRLRSYHDSNPENAVGVPFDQLIEKYSNRLSSDRPAFAPGEEILTAAERRKVVESPWQLNIELLSLPLGYKHISVSIGSRELVFPYIRLQAYASVIELLRDRRRVVIRDEVDFGNNYKQTIADYNLLGNVLLFGQTDNAQGINDSRHRERAFSLPLHYPNAVDAISRAVQFHLAFSAGRHPYQLWTYNSNTFAAGLVRHIMGSDEKVDEMRRYFAERQIKVPGFETTALPNLQFDPDFQTRQGESASAVVDRISRKLTNPALDCLEAAKGQLVRWQLLPLARQLENYSPDMSGSRPSVAGAGGNLSVWQLSRQ